MNNICNNIRQEFVRLFSKPIFFICIIIHMILIKLLLMSNIMMVQRWDAYQMILDISAMNNFNKVLVLAAAIPAATSYCDDIEDNYLELIIMRGNVTSYAVSKIFVSFISSFSVSFISLTLYSVYLGLRWGVGEESIQTGVLMDYAHSAFPYAAVLANVFLFSLVSAVYAVLGLCFSAYAKGRFAAMAAPIFVNVFVEVIGKYLPKAIYLFKIQYGNSAYGMGTTGTLLMSVMVCAGYIFAAYLLFKYKVRRRVSNESL